MTSSSSPTPEPAGGDPDAWRRRPNAPASGTVICAAADLPEGAAREYRFGGGRSAFAMFAIRMDGDVAAYLNLCPHFSLPLNRSPNRFLAHGMIVCSQHFARFRTSDGYCVEGACAGRWLDPVPVVEIAGHLLVGGGDGR